MVNPYLMDLSLLYASMWKDKGLVKNRHIKNILILKSLPLDPDSISQIILFYKYDVLEKRWKNNYYFVLRDIKRLLRKSESLPNLASHYKHLPYPEDVAGISPFSSNP